MTHRKIASSFGSAAFLTLRGAVAGPVVLIGAILTVACSGRTNPEHLGATLSLDSGTPSADDAGGPVDHDGRGLYRPCIGHNDFTSGSCAEDAICGSMYFQAHPEKARVWREKVHAFEDWTFDHLAALVLD